MVTWCAPPLRRVRLIAVTSGDYFSQGGGGGDYSRIAVKRILNRACRCPVYSYQWYERLLYVLFQLRRCLIWRLGFVLALGHLSTNQLSPLWTCILLCKLNREDMTREEGKWMEWMHERKKERKNEWMNEWKNKWKEGRKEEGRKEEGNQGGYKEEWKSGRREAILEKGPKHFHNNMCNITIPYIHFLRMAHPNYHDAYSVPAFGFTNFLALDEDATKLEVGATSKWFSFGPWIFQTTPLIRKFVPP